MEMQPAFIAMIENDIKRIDEVINSTPEDRWNLFRELDGRYQACIKYWYQGMRETNREGTVLYYNILMHKDIEIKDNLKLAKSKLESFVFGVNAASSSSSPTQQINITNNNGIYVNVTFEEVRSKVEDMTALSEDETKELLDRINKLEEIINSKDNKKIKWKNVAPILKWLANKSFEVAMMVLPLILKLQEQ